MGYRPMVPFGSFPGDSQEIPRLILCHPPRPVSLTASSVPFVSLAPRRQAAGELSRAGACRAVVQARHAARCVVGMVRESVFCVVDVCIPNGRCVCVVVGVVACPRPGAMMQQANAKAS